MTMAENLLSTTYLSIDEISKTLGYNYSANFIKSFKKTHGKTPLSFRIKKLYQIKSDTAFLIHLLLYITMKIYLNNHPKICI